MSTRAARQARIVELVSSMGIRSQTELARLLAGDGIEVTQATLSRDLDELGAHVARDGPRVRLGLLARVRGGHDDAGDPVAAEGVRGEQGDEGRVDAAG